MGAFVSELDSIAIGETRVRLDGRRSEFRTKETNLGNLVADAILAKVADLASVAGLPKPEVALHNGGGIRNDSVIPAGTLTRLDTLDVLPFSNFVALVPDISRTQFKALLEYALSDIADLGGRFAQIAGFRLTYDMRQPVGSRVREVTLDGGTPIVRGSVVQVGADLNVATIDFLTRGGDGYPFESNQPFTIFEGETSQDALEDYISRDLGGVVNDAARYPEGGGGRITRLP